MERKKLADTVAELAVERIASLLADRVAERIVKALMESGFDKQFASALFIALKKELEETG